VSILKTKLVGEAAQFVRGLDVLNSDNVTYDCLARALRDRFTEQLPAQFYFNQLYEARQEKDESPIHFLDRCRVMT
jgi:hypothetical protein